MPRPYNLWVEVGKILETQSIRASFVDWGWGQAIPEQKGGGHCGLLFARTALDAAPSRCGRLSIALIRAGILVGQRG